MGLGTVRGWFVRFFLKIFSPPLTISTLLVLFITVVAFRKDADFQTLHNDLSTLAAQPLFTSSNPLRSYRGVKPFMLKWSE